MVFFFIITYYETRSKENSQQFSYFVIKYGNLYSYINKQIFPNYSTLA